MSGPVVTFLSDFGMRDPYVGIMKGVVLGRCPDARLVDLTHEIPPQDVLAGALALESAVPWFPAGTVHVAVVDPGVGTERRGLLLSGGRATLVGPDNGLLSLAAERLPGWEARSIPGPNAPIGERSATFDGRDLFAPIGAAAAAGAPPTTLGEPIDDWVRLDVPGATTRDGGVDGVVLVNDRFGNAVTNIRLPKGTTPARVIAGGADLGPPARTYASVEVGAMVALENSDGRLEIAVRNGSAAECGMVPGVAVRAEGL